MCNYYSLNYLFHGPHNTLLVQTLKVGSEYFAFMRLLVIGTSWSSLVVGDEGCIGPSKKLLFMLNQKNYATHAWHNAIIVWLLGLSSCSSPSTKELHGYVGTFGPHISWCPTWSKSSESVPRPTLAATWPHNERYKKLISRMALSKNLHTHKHEGEREREKEILISV